MTGRLSTGVECDEAYWGRNLRQPVLFADAFDRLIEKHHDIFLEIAPHPVLAGAMGQCLRQRGHEAVVLHSMRRQEDEQVLLLRALGELYVRGYPVDWATVNPVGDFVRLPGYPWQHEHLWFDFKPPEVAKTNGVAKSSPGLPAHTRHLQLAQPADCHVWELEIDAQKLPFIDVYPVDGATMVAGTALVELATAAAESVFPGRGFSPAEIDFPAALFLPDSARGSLQVLVTARSENEASFEVYGRLNGADEAWTLHATGKFDVSPLPVR